MPIKSIKMFKNLFTPSLNNIIGNYVWYVYYAKYIEIKVN